MKDNEYRAAAQTNEIAPALPGKTMSLSKELRHRLAEAMLGRPCDFAEFDDAQIKAALSHGKVYAQLDRAVKGGTARGLSPATRDLLDKNTKAFALLDLKINHATQRLATELEAQQTEFLLIKGLPIAHLYYAASFLRHRVDVDVYVREADWEPTARRLEQKGYTVQGLDSNTASSKQFTATAPGNGPQAIVFDVHERINNRGVFQSLLPFDTCWAQRKAVVPLGEQVWTLSSAHQLMLSCMHRIAHGRNAERMRLNWLFDAHLMLSGMDAREQGEFADQALAAGIGAVCGDALQTAVSLFSSPLEPEVLTRLFSQRQLEPSAKLLDAGKFGWLLADLKAAESSSQRFKLLKETVSNQLRSD